MSHVYIGPTEVVREGLFPPRYDEHVRAFRWWKYSYTVRQYDDHVWRRFFYRLLHKGVVPRCPT